MSDFDEKSGYCTEDSLRRDEIAEAQAQQTGALLKGFASALGFGDIARRASEAVQQATEQAARCPKDGHLAPAGTRFCPECGSAKFCPECGTKLVQAGP